MDNININEFPIIKIKANTLIKEEDTTRTMYRIKLLNLIYGIYYLNQLSIPDLLRNDKYLEVKRINKELFDEDDIDYNVTPQDIILYLYTNEEVIYKIYFSNKSIMKILYTYYSFSTFLFTEYDIVKSLFDDMLKYSEDELNLSLFIDPLRTFFKSLKNVIDRYEKDKKTGFPSSLKTGNDLYKKKYLKYKKKYQDLKKLINKYKINII